MTVPLHHPCSLCGQNRRPLAVSIASAASSPTFAEIECPDCLLAGRKPIRLSLSLILEAQAAVERHHGRGET